MKYPVRPQTRRQWGTIISLAVAYVGLGAFLWFELPKGIVNTTPEDTASEWVWDLPLGWTLTIAVVFLLTGLAFAWAGGHFIEGWIRRRRDEAK
jgi:hypothetical protein